MLIKQLVEPGPTGTSQVGPEEVKSDNLKFRTDLRDQVMDGWSVIQ